jgi:hypothetical protein
MGGHLTVLEYVVISVLPGRPQNISAQKEYPFSPCGRRIRRLGEA